MKRNVIKKIEVEEAGAVKNKNKMIKNMFKEGGRDKQIW